MNDKFSWVPFYTELSQKLLQYRYNRKPLLNFAYNTLGRDFTSYLHEEDGRDFEDICPFTFIGIFNRGIKDENRLAIAEQIKSFLNIASDIPESLDGIPVLNNQKSFFFGFSDKRASSDIENLWTLFEKVLTDQDNIELIYNTVINQRIININITMGLYWIQPNKFIALDSVNRSYLSGYGIDVKAIAPKYKEYISLIEDLQDKMRKGIIKEKSFPEFSYNSWINRNNMTAMDINKVNGDLEKIVELLKYRKNIILEGAPGTGKTYDAIEIAVHLCSSKVGNLTREQIMSLYKTFVDEGRITFTTFHQSMDYEEFVEGLKPEIIEGSLNYNICDGIFKQIVGKASLPIVEEDVELGIRDNPTIWKVSLMGTYDNHIRKDCLENSRIRIGWDDYGPYIGDDTNYTYGGRIVLDAFINKMQVGDIVMSCYNNKTIDAIGVITGDYEWDGDLDEYKRTRSVNWLVKDIRKDIFAINKKVMTLSTVYRLNNISLENVLDILKEYKVIDDNKVHRNDRPYVLIIDEINRGNISKIFGELITLLEPDKRIGSKNEVILKLPYSKDEFGIPSNLFIIATMNTADRSLGYIDYAVRRRFGFVNMLPREIQIDGFNSELFATVSNLFIKNYDDYIENGKIEVSDFLSEEFRPEDVWIGHSYFIMTDEQGEDKTDLRLRYEIIPILKEYIKDGVFKPESIKEQIQYLETYC